MSIVLCIFSEPGRFKLKPEMSQTTFSNLRAWLKENLLLVITFSGVFLGVIIGVLLKPLELEPLTVAYLAYPGELFMRLLKLMILPLIIASLITGKFLHVTWFSYSFWSNFLPKLEKIFKVYKTDIFGVKIQIYLFVEKIKFSSSLLVFWDKKNM